MAKYEQHSLMVPSVTWSWQG